MGHLVYPTDTHDNNICAQKLNHNRTFFNPCTISWTLDFNSTIVKKTCYHSLCDNVYAMNVFNQVLTKLWDKMYQGRVCFGIIPKCTNVKHITQHLMSMQNMDFHRNLLMHWIKYNFMIYDVWKEQTNITFKVWWDIFSNFYTSRLG